VQTRVGTTAPGANGHASQVIQGATLLHQFLNLLAATIEISSQESA